MDGKPPASTGSSPSETDRAYPVCPALLPMALRAMYVATLVVAANCASDGTERNRDY